MSLLQIEEKPFQVFCYKGRYREPENATLSEMQLKVYQMCRAGFGRDFIAQRLHITVKRVGHHIIEARRKGKEI